MNIICICFQALFVGFGRDLKMNYTTYRFRSVELYNLMARLVEVNPAENNGKCCYDVVR